MDRNKIKYFWKCKDISIINLAQDRANLTRNEREVLRLLLTEERTQEQTAEIMELSVRKVQSLWYSATDKLLSIYWVLIIAEACK